MPTENSMSTLTLEPMTRDEAVLLVKRLLGSYPSLSLHDPETYIANLVSLLCGYPLWAGEKAVVQVKRETKFLPTEAELYPALEGQVKYVRTAAEWDAGARQTVADRVALLEGPKAPKPTYDELRAKCGENWGITNPDEKAKPERFPPLAELCERYGVDKATADSLPELKDARWKTAAYFAPAAPVTDHLRRSLSPAEPVPEAAE